MYKCFVKEDIVSYFVVFVGIMVLWLYLKELFKVLGRKLNAKKKFRKTKI